MSSRDSRSHRSSSSYGKALSVPIVNDALPSQMPLRTLDNVRAQVADEVAYRAVRKAEVLDDTKISVIMTYSRTDDVTFLKHIADSISHQLRLSAHLFAVATTGPPVGSTANYILIASSSQEQLQNAALLTSAKFTGRIEAASHSEEGLWVVGVKDVGQSTYDEEALWDVVRKSARAPMDPLMAPPGSRGIAQILDEARAKLQRLTPTQAYNELQAPQVGAPTFLVDIRPAAQREQEGSIHGSLVIERNVLEWRFDPRSSSKLDIANRYDLRIIIFCQEGYTSSLAAYSLQEIGLLNATDIIGGFKAWKEAGLPVHVPPPPTGPSFIASSDSGSSLE